MKILNAVKNLYFWLLSKIGFEIAPEEPEWGRELDKSLDAERREFVQRNHDNEIHKFIAMEVARMLSRGYSVKQASIYIGELDMPDYYVWHEPTAFFANRSIKNHILTTYTARSI